MHYHTGLAYETTQEFLDGAVPFISGGLAQEHAVMAITSPEKAQALREAAGTAADGVEFSSTDDWYMSQARAFSKFIDRARAQHEEGRRGLCILTDPSVAGLDEERVRRWLFVENLVSQILRTMPMSVMCTYDVHLSGLTRSQIEISHPHMATGAQICASSAFIDPCAFNDSAHAVMRGDVPADAQVLSFDEHSLTEFRAFVERTARNLEMSAAKGIDLVIAASEAAANAIEHGGGSGIGRVWRSGSEVICAIENSSGGIDNLAAGFVTPGWAEERGRGIWMMRQLCEWVDLRSTADGTSVRLHVRD